MKITPVLYLDDIESALPFWLDRLGFGKTVEVPHGDRIGFVIVEREGLEVMLQSMSSLQADRGNDFSVGTGSTSLYIEVPDFAEFREKLQGLEIVTAERVAFYGMREMAVRAPGGHVVCIAAAEKAS